MYLPVRFSWSSGRFKLHRVGALHPLTSLTFSLQDGGLGDASDRGPVGAVQPLCPGNCWELRHAALTLRSTVTGHHGKCPYECLYPGLSSVTADFDGHGCVTATVFYFLMGEDMSEGIDLRRWLCCSLYPSVWGSLLLFMLISTWFVRSRTVSRIQTAEKTLNKQWRKVLLWHYRGVSTFFCHSIVACRDWNVAVHEGLEQSSTAVAHVVCAVNWVCMWVSDPRGTPLTVLHCNKVN